MEANPKINRRDLLKLAAAAGGGLAAGGLLTACGRPPQEAGPTLAIPPPASPSPSPTDPSPGPAASATLPAEATTASTLPPPAGDPLPFVDGTFASLPLPPVAFDGGGTLLAALQQRCSRRSIRPDDLPLQVLGDLLWAAFGVNRPDGRRTAPSAFDVRDAFLLLVARQGVYRYQAEDHSLHTHLPGDLRALTGSQAFAASAPVDLVLASDRTRLAGFDAGQQEQWAWAHAGFILQNAYLFCAAVGLACVARSSFDRAALASALGLDGTQAITLAFSAGYPAG